MTSGSGDRIFLAPTPEQERSGEIEVLPPWPAPSPQTNWPPPPLQPPPAWPPVSPEIADASEWKHSKTPMPRTTWLIVVAGLLWAGALLDLGWSEVGGERWFSAILAVLLVVVIGSVCVGAVIARSRKLQMPVEYRSLRWELRLQVETGPISSRRPPRWLPVFNMAVGLCWVAFGGFRFFVLQTDQDSPAETGLVLSMGLIYLVFAAWNYFQLRYLKHLDKTAPIGSPAGWLRDEHGYLRWWDGYKWTLAFAPGEAERSRHAPG